MRNRLARMVLGWMLLWVFLLSFCVVLYSKPASAVIFGPYAVIAPIAVDGDTLRADVAIWPDLTADVLIRVAGVDAPELNASTACEKDLARKAKLFTDTWVQTHAPLLIGMVKPDKYSGRYDAVVTGRDGASLATALIESGYGHTYNGGARQAWCP